MKQDLVLGSPFWQIVFISFAVVLMLFQIVRGWRLGLPRQLVRIAAVVVSYSIAVFGGKALLPFLRPMIKVPDFVIIALGGAIMGLIVYSIINTIGAILFKRTGQQESGVVRLVYGFSGAFLGVFFGLFFLWLMVVGVRSLGAIGEAQVNAQKPRTTLPLGATSKPSRTIKKQTLLNLRDENSLAFSLARLKKSIELGPLGDVVKQTDILPAGIYETLGKVGEVFAEPERATRFLSYPGVMQLADNPKILALRADPEITNMIQQGRLFDLLQDERLIEVANDPDLAAQLKRFDLRKALEYAAKE